jgi:hypothetical protein
VGMMAEVYCHKEESLNTLCLVQGPEKQKHSVVQGASSDEFYLRRRGGCSSVVCDLITMHATGHPHKQSGKQMLRALDACWASFKVGRHMVPFACGLVEG